MISILRRIRQIKYNLFTWADRVFVKQGGIQDVFILGGMFIMSYGLYLSPLSFLGPTVGGLAMMLYGLGWLFRRPK